MNKWIESTVVQSWSYLAHDGARTSWLIEIKDRPGNSVSYTIHHRLVENGRLPQATLGFSHDIKSSFVKLLAATTKQLVVNVSTIYCLQSSETQKS
jgi:hypothetical protein